MLIASRRRRQGLDIWPGFVDAMASLLMVVIFVLLLFSIGQFLLNDALVGRDEALDRLRGQLHNLTSLLTQTREEKQSIEQRLQGVAGELKITREKRDDLQAQLAELTLKAHEAELALAALQLELGNTREQLAGQQAQVATLGAARDALKADLESSRSRLAEQQALDAQRAQEIQSLQSAREDLQAQLQTSRVETGSARERAEELTRQLAALNEQIARLNSALEVSEAGLEEKTLEVEQLGARLNEALVDKVEELAAYRSEFFGKLHEALKDNPDVRIEGDRFLLPSEVLFPSASATLDARGQREIAKVAATLKDIMAKIPDDMDWVLRVDGHTDRRPIRVAFPSNWELSSARATSIVKDLIAEGIPPEHLVAAGFAQYHPVDSGDSAEAYKRNRRIELKLTSR